MLAVKGKSKLVDKGTSVAELVRCNHLTIWKLLKILKMKTGKKWRHHQTTLSWPLAGQEQPLDARSIAQVKNASGELSIISFNYYYYYILHNTYYYYWNLVSADGNLLCETAGFRRLTVSVDLGVCVSMWREMMTFNELQQVGSAQEKQDRFKDWALW